MRRGVGQEDEVAFAELVEEELVEGGEDAVVNEVDDAVDADPGLGGTAGARGRQDLIRDFVDPLTKLSS